MANQNAKIDENYNKTLTAITDDANAEIRPILVDPTTGRLLVSAITSYEEGPITDGVNTSIKATVFDYANSNPLAVRLTDANGDYVASGAGEQYSDNTAVNAAYKGNLVLGTDGSNYQVLAVDSSGHLQVDVLTAPTIAVTGTFWQATQPVSLASVPSHPVTNAGTFVVQENGAALTSLQLIDNAVSGNGFNISQLGGAAVPIGAGTEAAAIRVTLPTDGTGVVKLGTGSATIGALVANQSVNVTQMNGVAVSMGSGVVGTGVQRVVLATDVPLPAGSNAIGKLAANSGVDIGDVDVPGSTVAHDDADSGNPHKIGFKAVLFDGSAPPNAAVAENDRVNAIGDEYGRQYVCDTHPNYWRVSADYAAAQTNTSVKAAPGAGLSLYITDIVISNGATAGNITLLDGSGGAVVFEIYPAINGGCSTNLRTPIKLTANTALCITSTTVTTHSINITGFIAP